MSKPILILLFLFIPILFTQCKKDDENWTYCVDCEISAWVGTYEGAGVYFSDTDGKTIIDVPTTVTIDSSSATELKSTVTAENYFTTSFTIDKTNNDYYINQPGSSKSLTLTLSKKRN